VQQLLTWTATGLGAGWLARTLMRSHRNFGLVGDLVTGWLGALSGGWLLRHAGVLAPDNTVGHVLVALAGAAALLVTLRLLHGAVTAAGVARAAGTAGALALEDRIRHLGQVERAVLTNLLKREHWARDTNQRFDAESTFGERVADHVATFGGSWVFIGLFGIVMFSWMALNEEIGRPFDPYPFILLNLVLSCLAALQAPIIMMSQNRQSAKDRLDAKNDYEVNLRAEMGIAAVHAKLDLLREQEWLRLMDVLAEQKRTLAAVQARLDELTASRE
jgi:uncharacterized membrane protein/uncharacterized membrane protein YeaQ/YmgE (transglycosylase-associated protein family)